MAIYRQIQTTYWQDDFVLTLTPEEKYFYLYLLTNSKTKQCGIYELPLQVAIMETGYNRETVIKLLQKFIEHGKIAVDWETHEVAMKNWLKHNPSKSNPKIIACVEKELKTVKNSELIAFAGYPMDSLSQQKQKEEQKEKEKQSAGDSELQKKFDLIWNQYPRKEGKKEAFRHFKASVKSDSDLANCEISVKNYVQSLKNKGTPSQYFKQGSTFFNNWQEWVSPDETMMGKTVVLQDDGKKGSYNKL